MRRHLFEIFSAVSAISLVSMFYITQRTDSDLGVDNPYPATNLPGAELEIPAGPRPMENGFGPYDPGLVEHRPDPADPGASGPAENERNPADPDAPGPAEYVPNPADPGAPGPVVNERNPADPDGPGPVDNRLDPADADVPAGLNPRSNPDGPGPDPMENVPNPAAPAAPGPVESPQPNANGLAHEPMPNQGQAQPQRIDANEFGEKLRKLEPSLADYIMHLLEDNLGILKDEADEPKLELGRVLPDQEVAEKVDGVHNIPESNGENKMIDQGDLQQQPVDGQVKMDRAVDDKNVQENQVKPDETHPDQVAAKMNQANPADDKPVDQVNQANPGGDRPADHVNQANPGGDRPADQVNQANPGGGKPMDQLNQVVPNFLLKTSHNNQSAIIGLDTALQQLRDLYNDTPDVQIPGFDQLQLQLDSNANFSVEQLESLIPMQTFNLTFSNFNLTYAAQLPTAGTCADTDVVVYVMSMLDEKSTAQRQALREILFDKDNLPKRRNLIHKFVVGRLGNETAHFGPMLAEMARFDDIIYYNVAETYRDNFIKWHTMHEWHMRFCPHVPHFVKTDDDTTADFGRMEEWLERDFDGATANKTHYVVCQRMRGFKPIRSPKNERWFIPRWEFNEPVWPDYCYGYFVLATNYTVEALLNAQRNVSLVHMDDCLYTGIVRRETHVELVDFYGIHTGRTRGRCSRDATVPYMFVVHLSKTPAALARDLHMIKRRRCVRRTF